VSQRQKPLQNNRFWNGFLPLAPYHLNKSGRKIRTRTLINDIEKWINASVKEIKYEVPRIMGRHGD
jgi:hypothetical protein